MATLKLSVSSPFPQTYSPGYAGNLIESLIATVEKAEHKNAELRAVDDDDVSVGPLTIDEVLDRSKRSKITQRGFDFGAPEDLGAKIDAQRRVDRRSSGVLDRTNRRAV
jgi:hypothetical protein